MATQLQLRSGTATQIIVFTGAAGEPVYNSTSKSIVMQDGVTLGGFELARNDFNNVNNATFAAKATAAGVGSGASGSGATAHAVLTSLTVSSIVVDTPGSNYVAATVTIIGGGGTGATANAIISNGTVASIVVTSPGSGYASPPTITILNGAAGASANLSYLTVASETSSLPSSRIIQCSGGVVGVDSGAGAAFSISANLSNVTPAVLGAAAAGVSTGISRSDHIHAMPTPAQVGAVNLTGDTMTGFLVLNADPVANLQAATKHYVDTVAAGGSGSGPVTLTGDVTGSGTGTVVTTLAATGISPGIYKSVTVDIKGRITAGTNPTTLGGFGITDGVQNALNTPSLSANTLLSRPLFGTTGRLYIATDTNSLFRDTGAAWSLLQPAITGDISIAAGTTNATLAASGIAAATYAGITFNTKGVATNATTLTTLVGYGITDAIQNQGSTPSINAGIQTSRPTAGVPGRLYIATDTTSLFRDTGSAWTLIQPAISGDVNISAGGTSANLATTGVVAGTYAGITFDAKGRATTATALTSLSGYGITDGVQNVGATTPSINANIFASRPAASVAGRIYIATDTHQLFRDTGASWQPLPGQVTLDTGSVGAPSLNFSGSTTTGLYSPTTNTFAAVANGVEVVRWLTAASAVNSFTVSPAATGVAPAINAVGSDPSVNLALTTQGAASGVTINGDGINPYSGFRNYLMNPTFSFWTNGTSFNTPPGNFGTGGSVTATGWIVTYNGSIGAFIVSQQAFALGQTAVPGEPRFWFRWNQTVAGSGSTARQVYQNLVATSASDANAGVRLLAGQKVTVTFWAQADTARTVTITLRQFFGAGGTPSANADTTSGSFNVTTSWQRFVFTTTLPSLSGKVLGTDGSDTVQAMFNLPLNTTMTIDLANVQFEKGGISTAIDSFGSVAASALYGDLAERYAADAIYAPGTVVVFGGESEITLTTETADVSVAGVISTTPAVKMNYGAGSDNTHPFVALRGRVPCKVVGPVRKGDLMVTSSIAGYAMSVGRENLRAAVFGKALQNFDGERGVIEVAVI